MAVGDVNNPKRVRVQSNERLDDVDADALARGAREHLDAYSRAIEATPRNVGSSTPTGLIFQGFGLTLNPTGPSDNKVRVQSALGVALDSDGRMLVKESGVQVDLTLSAGNSQIYAYFIEDDSDTTVRRRISVSSPFTESGTSQPTKLKGNVAFFTRTGDQTSIVASDVVNGATTALCFLGVANNASGTVTMTGYNATTAPNGSFATNRLTTVAIPTTLPPNNAANGSVATMHGFVNAALYALGQGIWKGSKNFTPSAANNFGAYTPPTVGLDGLFDVQAEGTLTPVTKWRDWQQNTRFLVDHQGYPGGQISVKDENWFVPATSPVNVDPTTGYKLAGSAAAQTASPFGVNLSTSSDQWLVPIDRSSVPIGAIITNIIVSYTTTNSANTLTGALTFTSTVSATTSTQVSRTVTTGSSPNSFDVLFQPAATQWQKWASPAHRLELQLSCAITSGSVTVYNIQISYIQAPVGWTQSIQTDTTVGASDGFNYLDPISGFNQRHVQMITKGSGLAILIGAPETYVDDSLAHSTEFMLRTGTVIDANNVFTPLLNVFQPGGLGISWGLSRGSGQANWDFNFSNGTGGIFSTGTGVAFTSNTVYRVKYEFQGASRNSTGFARARCWINGSLVATLNQATATVPGAVGLRFDMQALTTSNGPYDIRIGRIRRAWNHLAAGDNV